MNVIQKFEQSFLGKKKLHHRIGKLLFKINFLSLLVTWFSSFFRSLNTDFCGQKEIVNYKNFANKESIETIYGYSDELQGLRVAVDYAAEIAAPNFGVVQGESYELYREQILFLKKIIREKKPRKVINFGVCYAYVDSILAVEFPDVEFIGIDRGNQIKLFNESEFSDIKNLKFIAADIFQELEKAEQYKDCLFFHSRILLFMPKDFILRLYNTVKQSGFSWLVGFEPNGLSIETQEPYVFDENDRSSVLWRNGMFIHNYIGLANQVGLKVSDASLFSTGHSDPDYRVFKYFATNELS